MLEVALLMSVKNCILNAQNNRNSISVVYDALTGAYLLTQPETYVDRDLYSNVVMFLENSEGLNTLEERLTKYNIPLTSGRALFSAIFPEDFYYRKGDVMIKDGILVSGVITSEHIGSSHGSIIKVMMKDYSTERTVDFITDIYNMMRKYLDVRGFSVGLDDCFLVGDNPEKSIEYEVQRAKMLVKSMGWKLTDPLEEERREKQIMAYLNTAKGLGARISGENMRPGNAFNVMAKSGAKGSTFNIAQITGILGQQFVQGQRMPEVISGNRRCLPYFPEDSLDPAARGFCQNSFLKGLSPPEMFFHQAGGREGLTDTAIKTADTGALHHRVVKALEDVKVYEDGSTRNAFGIIFQYAYGEDGFNGEMLETVSTKTGKFTSFIDMKRLAGRINSKYGYSTPGDPDPEDIVPVNKNIIDTYTSEFPEVPVIPAVSGVTEIGDVVYTATGKGTVKQVEGERVLVQYEGTNPEWVKVEKIETKQ
jgi:DNA-directed RNA polymerase beta' subunit